VELLLDSGPNELETLQNTFSQRGLDKFGFIQAWAKTPLTLRASKRQTPNADTPSLSRLRASFAGCRQMIDGRETNIYLVNHILGAFFVSSCPRQKYQGHLFRPKRARGDQGRAKGAAG